MCIYIFGYTNINTSVNIPSTIFLCQVKSKVENGKCRHLRQYKFDGLDMIQLIFLQ